MATTAGLVSASRDRLRRPAWTNVLLAGLVATLLVLAYFMIASQPQRKALPRTTVVQRGSVLSTVSATGNVQSPRDLNLRFQSDGTLVAVYVGPGQRVRRGQVLGLIDSTDERNDLRSALADLRSARGNLQQILEIQSPQERARDRADAVEAQTTVRGNIRALADARRVRTRNGRHSAATVAANSQALADTRAQAAANAQHYDNAIDQARDQLDADESELDRVESDNSDHSAVQDARNAVRDDRAAVQNAEDDKRTGIATDQKAINDAQGTLSESIREAAAQNAADTQSVNSAAATLASSRASLRTTLATNRVNAQPPKSGDLAAAQAQVVQSEVTVDNARQAVEDTILRAPADGTVAAVNNKVGEEVTGSSNRRASTAGVSSSSSSASGSASASSSDTGSTSGNGETITTDPDTAFVQLTDLEGLQVKAAFTETDAAKLRIGQPATVSVPALEGRRASARLAEIDALSTVTSNVVTYEATFVIESGARGLKPGMTAEPQVVVERVDGILTVPSSAVHGTGASATVTVLRSGGQIRVPVTTGLSANGSTAIIRGLEPGDRVVLPQASSSRPAEGESRGPPTIAGGRGRGFGGPGGAGGAGGR